MFRPVYARICAFKSAICEFKFKSPCLPEVEQEDIQELHKRTMNRHTEEPIINTPRKDASGSNEPQLRRMSRKILRTNYL